MEDNIYEKKTTFETSQKTSSAHLRRQLPCRNDLTLHATFFLTNKAAGAVQGSTWLLANYLQEISNQKLIKVCKKGCKN